MKKGLIWRGVDFVGSPYVSLSSSGFLLVKPVFMVTSGVKDVRDDIV